MRGDSPPNKSDVGGAELGALEGFGLFIGKGSIVTVDGVSVLACRRAQVAGESMVVAVVTRCERLESSRCVAAAHASDS